MWPYISLLLKLFLSVQVNTTNKASKQHPLKVLSQIIIFQMWYLL